jgi:hypothetical protein
MALRNTLFQRPDRITEPLYVVTSVFNSPRFRSRWKLYQDFAEMVKAADAILYTVEVAFGDREFVIEPDPCAPERLLQLRTRHEIWLKENALNLLVQRLPCDWRYVATLDADIRFARPDWDDEIVQALQHYSVLQTWTQEIDLDSKFEFTRAPYRSVGWAVRAGVPVQPGQYYGGEVRTPGRFFHPGFGWAYRRDAWDGLGGLLDVSIIGSADHYMAQALLGQVSELADREGISGRYRDIILEWQSRANIAVHRNIGAVDGLISHYWHGPKVARQYESRKQILRDTQFNPDTDLLRDSQGLYQISPRNDTRTIALRDRVRQYFHSRREDDPSP